VRFDYSGHGESEGAFTDGTITFGGEKTPANASGVCDQPGGHPPLWVRLIDLEQ
jgi:hypothetical protein